MRSAARPLNTLRKRLARLLSDCRGATAVEFGMVVVPFFGLVFLILEVSLYHFSQQSLDYSVRQASRLIMTGQVGSTAASAGTFKTAYVCPNVFWTISCDKVVINSYLLGKTSDPKASSGIYAHLDAAKRTLNAPATVPAQQRFCLGKPGDYVYLDVAYPYPSLVGTLLTGIADTTFLMRSSAVVFNELGRSNTGASC